MGNMERGTTWNKVEQSGTRSVFCRISLDGGGIRETGDGDLAREEVISVMVLIERKKTFLCSYRTSVVYGLRIGNSKT